ncbi:hypothetical protein ACSBR2_007841 [Camellia fascicularis]
MGGGGGSNSSSSEDDGDADWRAAIDSVAATTTDGLASASNGSTTKSTGHDEDNEVTNHKPQKLKHYQIKAQKILDDILEKTLEIVQERIHVLDNDAMINDNGVRLFKHAPPGIVFDHIGELQRPTKKPRILPGRKIDENSKTFKSQLQSVSVDGTDIIAAARDASRKSLAKLEAKDAAAKAAAKREEERVAQLKKIRGERWLPSIARDMRVKFKEILSVSLIFLKKAE